jgi:hypothetical protein
VLAVLGAEVDDSNDDMTQMYGVQRRLLLYTNSETYPPTFHGKPIPACEVWYDLASNVGTTLHKINLT